MSHAGDDILRFFGRAPTRDIGEILKKVDPTEVLGDISKLKVLDDQAHTKLMSSFKEASEHLDTAISEYGRKAENSRIRLERALRKVDEARNKIAYWESAQLGARTDPQAAMRAIEEQQSMLERYSQLIPEYSRDAKRSSAIFKKLNELGSIAIQDPAEFLRKFKAEPNLAKLLDVIKPLRELEQSALELIAKRSQISQAISPNINNNKSFLMEYITHIAPRPDTDILKSRWMLNPTNASKLSEILYNPQYSGFAQKIIKKRFDPEQIAKGQIPKELLNLANRPPDSIAKKLGITLAAAAALIPALKIFSWFSSEKVHEEAVGTLDDLDSFKAVGMGKVLVDTVKTAINAMYKSRKQAESKMGSADAKVALTSYVESVARVKNTLDKVLPRWSEVVRNSDKPEVAKNAGAALERLNSELDTNLDALNAQVSGEVAITGEKPEAPRTEVSRQGILDVQEYLSTKNPYIGSTGILDRETVKTLRELEQTYNSLGNTDRFTGLLVDPARNHLAPADDLRFIEKEMSKYK